MMTSEKLIYKIKRYPSCNQRLLDLNKRLSDIVGMRNNYDKKETVFRQQKTGREIAIAFNPELLRELKQYCNGRDPDEALIPNRNAYP